VKPTLTSGRSQGRERKTHHGPVQRLEVFLILHFLGFPRANKLGVALAICFKALVLLDGILKARE
jgi:hypothetical protein